MISFAKKEIVTITNGGTITHLIKIENQIPKQYFALKLNQYNQVENNFFQGELIDQEFEKMLYFRKHEERIPDPHDSKTILHLFSWKKGMIMSNKIDKKAFEEKKYFSETVIQKYLAQLLESLYQLHQKQILGRVFKTSNILVDSNDCITLLDYGFGPEIAIDGQIILAPPEIIEKLNQKSECIYDIKIDAWLIGVLLYHLIKLKPLTNLVYPDYQKYLKELEDIKKVEDSYVHKLIKTEKQYSQGLLDLTQQLLTYDPAHRLDFLQIYQHPYIQSMVFPSQGDYVSFYLKIQNNNNYFINLINIREQPRNLMIDTGQLAAPSDIVTPKSQPLSQLYQIEQDFDYSYDSYQTSRYFQIWKYIQLEQYRCFLLKQTVIHLTQSDVQNEYLREFISYGLLKMSLLIRQELIVNLKNLQPPWQVQLWDEFKNDTKYKLLIQALESAQDSQYQQLIEKYNSSQAIQNQSGNKYIKQILDQLNEDQKNQFKFQNQTSLDFKQKFRQFTSLFMQLLDPNPTKDNIKLNLLTILSHCINRFTDYQNLRQNLIEINTTEDQCLSQIHQFIETSQDNIQSAVKQINKFKGQFP